jgi:hypothetical protein
MPIYHTVSVFPILPISYWYRDSGTGYHMHIVIRRKSSLGKSATYRTPACHMNRITANKLRRSASMSRPWPDYHSAFPHRLPFLSFTMYIVPFPFLSFLFLPMLCILVLDCPIDSIGYICIGFGSSHNTKHHLFFFPLELGCMMHMHL